MEFLRIVLGDEAVDYPREIRSSMVKAGVRKVSSGGYVKGGANGLLEKSWLWPGQVANKMGRASQLGGTSSIQSIC